MSSSQDADIERTSPDHSRSGADVAEAIGVAERGSSVREVHDRGTENTTREAPVEQRHGDPEMTEGQVALGEGEGEGEGEGDGEPGRHHSIGLDPTAGSSGAAQSEPGARISDRVAAGEEPPADPSAS